MSLTYSEAKDQMRSVFYDAFDSAATTILGYKPDIRWAGVELPNSPDPAKFWCRHSIQTVDDGQATLSNNVTGPDKRRYNAAGLIFVQMFMPKSHPNADSLLTRLAELARNAHRRQNLPCSVWFYNARINDDLPIEQDNLRVNVVIEFEYDEIM